MICLKCAVINATRHTASTRMYSLTFCVHVMFPQQSNPCPDCKSAHSAQLGGIPYHSSKLHPGLCNSVGMQPRTNKQTDT